jgi:hypothetical protein
MTSSPKYTVRWETQKDGKPAGVQCSEHSYEDPAVSVAHKLALLPRDSGPLWIAVIHVPTGEIAWEWCRHHETGTTFWRGQNLEACRRCGATREEDDPRWSDPNPEILCMILQETIALALRQAHAALSGLHQTAAIAGRQPWRSFLITTASEARGARELLEHALGSAREIEAQVARMEGRHA